jgi:mRNA interferase MazF
VRDPGRGEVWLFDLGMTAKTRPCLVLSVAIEDSDRALLTLVPHTTSVRNTRFEAVLETRFLKVGAFDAQGLVSVPVSRAMRRLGTVGERELTVVEDAVCRWLKLPCIRGTR